MRYLQYGIIVSKSWKKFSDKHSVQQIAPFDKEKSIFGTSRFITFQNVDQNMTMLDDGDDFEHVLHKKFEPILPRIL